MSVEVALKATFENLRDGNFRITSPPSTSYNCLSWAVGTQELFWDPINAHAIGYYWPRRVPRQKSVSAYVRALESEGYERCVSPDFEAGYEKIAIYCREGAPEHVARQVSTRRWTSKLGTDVDIEHDLSALAGAEYGEPQVFMRRALRTGRRR